MDKICKDVVIHNILPWLSINDLGNLSLVNHLFNSCVSSSEIWKTLRHWKTLEKLQREAMDAWYLKHRDQEYEDIDEEADPRPTLPTVGLDEKIDICHEKKWWQLFDDYRMLKLIFTAKAFNALLIMSGSAVLRYPK
jgi:hypothetical protein